MAAVGKTSNKPCHEPEDYDRVIALFHFATDVKRSLLEDHLHKNGLNVIDLFNAKREEILLYEDIRQALRKTSIVLPSDLSLNTLNYILKSHCYKLYWNSCLDEAKLTLEEFLNTHRSKIYKLMQCTMQDNSSFYLQENSILLSKEDFNLLFVTELDPSHLEIKQSNDTEDTFFAKQGIQLFSLSYELQNILLNALCPLREAVNHVTALQRNICKTVVLKEKIHHEIWSTMEKYTTIIAKEYNKISEVIKIQSIRNSYQGKKQCLENHRRILDDALNDFFFLDDLDFCQRVRSQLNDLSLQDVMNLCGKEIPVVLQHGRYRNGMYPEAIFKHADKDLQCFVAAYGSQVDESAIGEPSQKDCESEESKIDPHNYLKLIMLLKDMGQKVFIDVLKDRLPGAIFGNAFQGMRDRLRPYLNNNDFKKLCPDGAVYSGDLHDLELSLLYVILRCLNTIPPHGQGWGSVPAETDRSISANIDRIRIAKNNYVSHFPNCYLPHDVFKKAWEENRKCIIELGGETYEETIDKLLTTAISPIMERELIDAVKRLQGTDRLTLINIKTFADMIAKTLQELRYFNSQINGARIVQDNTVGTGQSPAAAITLHIAGSSLPSERQLENRLEELDSEHTSVTSIKNGSIIFGLAISALVYKSPGFLIWVIDDFLKKVFLHSSARIQNDEVIIVSMVKTDRDIRNMVPLAFRKKCEALDRKKVLQYLEFDRKELATGNVLKMLVEYLFITADDYTFITHTFSGKKQAHQLLTYLLCTKEVWLPGFLFIIQQVHGTTTIENLILKAADLGGYSVKSESKKYKKGSASVVVAIDFGTTYSGYAYSYRDDYKKDHTQIHSNNDWKSGDGLATSKTPTVILFDKDKKFSKFGYEAESKYHTLQEDEEAEGWRYFRRFKMRLFREEKSVLTKADKITKDLQVEDDQGKPMSAMVVISESIKYLKDHFLQSSLKIGFKLEPGDVHFVLTVPAIWEDRAKQFMRESAKMAGIPDEMLTLAYEPEAAAIYCKELTVQKKGGADSSSLSSFEPGQQFMVLDCGGGTVDITAYQIQNDGDLRELERPTGGPWGGTYVDKQYITFLQDLFGRDVWQEYALEDPEDVLEIERRFEAKKKSVHATADDQTTIPFPSSLFTKYQLAKKYSSVEEGLKKSRYADSVKVKKDRLRFDHQLVKAFFKNPVDSIVKHVKYLLNESQLSRKDIRTILMVGGFSDSSVLSERIIAEFKKYNVICPKDAVNAIMKGAVIFGHNPYLISERISPRTYGISVNKPFNDKVHPDKLRMYYDGRAMCTDIFQPIVQKGHPIIVGKTVFEQRSLPTRATDTEASIEMYESTSECPMYTIDKGVRRLGDLSVSLPDISKGKNRPIIIEVSFGYTEIKVRAYEEGTNNEAEATFNCLFS